MVKREDRSAMNALSELKLSFNSGFGQIFEFKAESLKPATTACQYYTDLFSYVPDNWCSLAWDGIMCWPPSPPGEVAQPCPSYIAGFERLVRNNLTCVAFILAENVPSVLLKP